MSCPKCGGDSVGGGFDDSGTICRCADESECSTLVDYTDRSTSADDPKNIPNK
jgi:hypothetical protein